MRKAQLDGIKGITHMPRGSYSFEAQGEDRRDTPTGDWEGAKEVASIHI